MLRRLVKDMQNKMDLKEIRKKAKESSEKELIREAIRARNFSGADTLRQGMNLIDFALRVNRGAL
ncbi:Uncharacterised protein [uncultured archaeon]|nr:Uncharacterised protein [uncultured archaeon]